ncbi:prepilin-type N-terminal cleavage/methylation domain-containing protein [Thermus filiformis]|uniref:Secretion system protein n=1 Tax=Thermus filiformis TaxID=276 RepID=A0A0A2WXG2_THEFI|nr:prepilin-type N-terminal cleavage/methylation domain-containing protein [Thermus filiformis]KGQ22990.1 secretion system protein [Thermus filiformis]
MKAKGLTLLEVILSLAIVSLVLLALSASLVSSLRQTAITGGRTQAVQILNYLGRRVAGGESALLPTGTLSFDYGTLRNRFPDLPREARFANPDLYRAAITNLGTPAWAGNLALPLNEYRIQVCWRQSGQESCTEARTFSSPPSAGDAPPLPGIN